MNHIVLYYPLPKPQKNDMCAALNHFIYHLIFFVGVLGMSVLGGFASIYFTNGAETKLSGKSLFLRINVSLFMGWMAALLAMDLDAGWFKIILSAGGGSFAAVDILPAFSKFVIERVSRFFTRGIL